MPLSIIVLAASCHVKWHLCCLSYSCSKVLQVFVLSFALTPVMSNLATTIGATGPLPVMSTVESTLVYPRMLPLKSNIQMLIVYPWSWYKWMLLYALSWAFWACLAHRLIEWVSQWMNNSRVLPNLLPLHLTAAAVASVAAVWRRDPHKAHSVLQCVESALRFLLISSRINDCYMHCDCSPCQQHFYCRCNFLFFCFRFEMSVTW